MAEVIPLNKVGNPVAIKFEDELVRLIETLNDVNITYIEIIGVLEIQKLALFENFLEINGQET